MNKIIIFLCSCVAILGAPIFRTSVNELIVGGQPSKIEEFPYQVAFSYRNIFFCSGSIISPTHIVTAAHCLVYFPSKPMNLLVRAGSSNTTSGGQTVYVKEIHKHPKFSLRYVDYDVAVVVLSVPLKFSSSVRPLKLSNVEPSKGEEVRVSGWGYQNEKGVPAGLLHSVKVKIVDRSECARSYGRKFRVTERMICAADEDKDACYGDSGGPLVYKGNLIGIVSSGEGCARRNYPGIYTNTFHPEVKEFILKITGIKI